MPNHSYAPRALIAGCLLALLSAAVNACFLIKFGTSVSHLTGDVSKVAMNAAIGHGYLYAALWNLLSATTGFFLGATCAGYFVHHPTMEQSQPYHRATIMIGLLLIVAYLFLPLPAISIGIAGVACGFQNALATHYRGMVLRTTHITGLLTDLGAAFGMCLKGHRIAAWKFAVPSLLVTCFFIGAAIGSFSYMRWEDQVILYAAFCYLALGMTLAKLQ